MRKRRMATITFDPNFNLQKVKEYPQHRVLFEEIEGLIKAYKDGHVESPQIVPNVTSKLPLELGVTSSDVVIDRFTNIWARLYVPKILCDQGNKLPLLIYFHGGGFCVGSASWICYHEFLTKLASIANCVIMSVNYRLAPENRLPAAYDDGVKTIVWIRQKVLIGANEDYWWLNKVDFSSIYLAGDSAGGNIAHNIAIRLRSRIGDHLNPITLKGTILIQSFFGGESRTYSEKYTAQLPQSALTLASADTYWRLALPTGANRDHPWCNPVVKESVNLVDIRYIPRILVCISELDVLKDRNLEFCATLNRIGNKKVVEYVMFKGVGHAFQVLNKSQVAQERTADLIAHIKTFISR